MALRFYEMYKDAMFKNVAAVEIAARVEELKELSLLERLKD